MSEDKIKVKDLATTLGQDPKDLLGVCKELGISTKSAGSLLKPDEISKIKAHAAAKQADSAVKLRRRKPEQTGSEQAGLGQASAEQANSGKAEANAQAKNQGASAATEQAKGANAQKPVKKNDANPKRKPGQNQNATTIATPVATAKVISKPTDEPASPVPSPASTAPASAPTTTTVASAEAKKLRVEGKPAQSANAANNNSPVLSAEPEKDAQGKPVSSAPAKHNNENEAVSQAKEGQSDENRAKKKKAPREEQGAPQVRVISKPDPNAPQARPVRQEQARDGNRPAFDPNRAPRPPFDPNRPRPPFDPNRAPRPPFDPNRPRPPFDPNRAPRPAFDPNRPRPPFDPNRAPRPPFDPNRPRPPFDPNRPRPPFDPNRAPRPAGGAPFPDKDAKDGGFRRPAAGGGGRPAGGAPRPPGFTPPAGAETEQSKKKRNKDKRTVDFSTDFNKKKKEMDGDESGFSHFGRKSRGRRRDAHKPVATQPTKAIKRIIKVDELIRVADLAHQMGLKSSEIIKVLLGLGVMATINQTLDIDTATLVTSEFGYEVEKSGFSESTMLVDEVADSEENLQNRPPVITIMGHVDHGKTSLLDALRKASVATGEAGGITQHIGAYHVTTKKGEIVFLDTPGHEAFTAMRARGAQVTDIVVLVVAADDGVMEQTREAINHAKAAGVPIVVAVNKMDKESIDIDRVKRELSDQGLMPEEWGGDTVFSYVSAKTGQGLDEFMELLALQAEILELKANPNKLARGHVVESRLDRGRGALGTVLIQQGTLHVGDTFVCGIYSGKVRALFDDQGKKVTEAGPSIPVEVQGFEGVPEAGEEFICLADEKMARRIAEARGFKQREKDLAKASKVTLETFLARRPDDVAMLNLNLVIKADVHGSLEAIVEAMQKLATEQVRVQIIHSGIGAITESDIMLAAASSAIIIGFNVRPAAKIKDIAENESVEIRFYDIIYKLVEEVRQAMEGMLAPISKEAYLGQAEVRQAFNLPKAGVVAGCFVNDGKITRNASIRLLRGGVVVHTGKISSLKRFKDDMREVLKGYECGISIENYNDIKPNDIIEAFEITEEAAKL